MVIKNVTDIEIFAEKLFSSDIEFPMNVSIQVELTARQFNKIVPKDFRCMPNLEYNTYTGIKILLIKS